MLSLSSLFGEDSTVLGHSDFQMLLLASMLPSLGSALLSPILETLRGPFGVSPAEIGLMMSAYTAPAIVLMPLAGVLADRCGRKPMIVGGLVLFGLAGTAIAFTTSFNVALALRFVQGIGFSGLNPIIVTSIGDLYEGSVGATAQGIRFTLLGITQSIFPIVAGILVVVAWQYPFVIYAVSLPIAFVLYLRFEEPTDLEWSRDVQPAGETPDETTPRSVRSMLGERWISAIVLARGLPMVVWIGFLTYNSFIVVRLIGGTPGQAGLLAAAGSIMYATSATQIGRITSLFDSRLKPLIAGHLGLGGGFAVVVVSPTLPVAIAGSVLSGVGFGILTPTYRSIITDIPPEHQRGSFVSLTEAFSRATTTATPVIMGASIVLLTPVVGVGHALQVTGIGTSVVAGGGGILCLLVASASREAEIPDIN